MSTAIWLTMRLVNSAPTLALTICDVALHEIKHMFPSLENRESTVHGPNNYCSTFCYRTLDITCIGFRQVEDSSK